MKFYQPLVLSLLLHLVLWNLLHWLAPKRPAYLPIQPIEIKYKKVKPKQIVPDTSQKEKLSKLIHKLKKKAEILSKYTQRVKEEQIAKKTGPTFPSQTPEQTSKNLNQFKPKNKHRLNNTNTSRDDVTPTRDSEATKTLAKKILQYEKRSGTSKSNFRSPPKLLEHIPGIKQGGFTSLNTDEFLYYTFYSRVNEKFGHRWASNIRSYAHSLSPSQLKNISKKTRITDLEIILNRRGEYLKHLVKRSSGINQLDEAAIRAFKEAAPFPNPPEEMIKKDGRIHIYYRFYIFWK